MWASLEQRVGEELQVLRVTDDKQVCTAPLTRWLVLSGTSAGMVATLMIQTIRSVTVQKIPSDR